MRGRYAGSHITGPALIGFVLGICALHASSCAAAEGVPGESSSSDVLAEVIVTATRRPESESKVPISMSALSKDAMDLKGIRDFTDVARFTPGVQIDANQTNTISIRGISSSGGADTTGIYIDDTPIQIRTLGFNPSEALPKTFDIQRVEVLRGPQGTLFGAGSEGGTVRYIMTQPSLDSYSTYARSEVAYTDHGQPSYEAGIAFGGPAVPQVLGFRISAWYRRDGGWIDRIDPTTLSLVDPNTNRSTSAVLRGAAEWAPASSIRVSPSIVWQKRQAHDDDSWWPLYSNPDRSKFVSANPTALTQPDEFLLPALKVTVDFENVQLSIDSSYLRRRDTSGYDGTLYSLGYYQTLGWLPGAGGNALGSSPYAGTSPCAPQGVSCYPLLDGSGIHLPRALAAYRSPATVTNNQDNFTEELRLQSSNPDDRISWTVGAFFSVNKTFSWEQIHDPMIDQLFLYLYDTTAANVFGTASNPDGSTYLPNGDSYYNRVTSHDRQLAGFGEAVWGLTDKLKLTTGIRVSRTDFDFLDQSDGPTNYGPGGGAGQQHERPVTERAGLSYQFDPNNMAYTTYSTGFRIGGANPQIPYGLCAVDFQNFGISGVPPSYRSDTTRSYEIGSKNIIAGRLRLASSLYYIQWKNIQQSVLLPNCALQYTSNLGSAVSKGADLQADLELTDALSIESAIGYNDPYYTSSSVPGPLATVPLVSKSDAVVGQSGLAAPPWTVALALNYKFRALGHESFARVDYQHETRASRPTPAQDPATVQYLQCSTATGSLSTCQYGASSNTFMSLRIGQEWNGFTVSGFVDNLLNTHVTTNFNYSGVDGSGPQPAASPLYRNFTFRPRTFGLTFTYKN